MKKIYWNPVVELLATEEQDVLTFSNMEKGTGDYMTFDDLIR